MSTAEKIHPQELVLPVSTDGGLWVRQQPFQEQQQHQNQHSSPDLAQQDPLDHHLDQQCQQRPQQPQLLTNKNNTNTNTSNKTDLFVFVNNSNLNSSSSDLATPLTPTFSSHGGNHLRYASSTSSLDLQQSFSSACSDSPVSPNQSPQTQTQAQAQNAANASPIASASTKRLLPDVQEDPLERDDGDDHTLTDLTDEQLENLYDCLCDSPCIHQTSADMSRSADWTHSVDNDISHFDYDMGFLSDGDVDPGLPQPKVRNGAESPLNGLTVRLGSRFTTLNRWRSTKRRNRAFTAISEPSIDFPPPLSRATSTSRSSSLSAPSRKFFDRTNEPPLPPTPALSFYEYESADSVHSAIAIDIDRPSVRESIERERALATTPLLPPLLTEAPSISPTHQSRPPSPLQSPTVAPQFSPESDGHTSYATPPLSTKPSISSFRPPLLTSMSSPTLAMSEVVVTIPNILEQHDAWSDRLGHANYTILPRPYRATAIDLETLRTFRADWDLARINYTKHIVRTGEHYGTTSKTYALTQAKWLETEREWKAAHDSLCEGIAVLHPGIREHLDWDRLQDDAPTSVPRMLDAEGKFPDLGDEDIVGPMVRDAVMARDSGSDGENAAKKFWKNLAGKVGLRK
ncbi:hypothetical protein N0V82_010826 [Gnomoniopsis sp. IMI 355080]|nr:hypothetical protein N0V82_010826 [Gnomoniopsis sp. IMI 355080]